jgi:transcriptional regulator with XRE-family HTH domain
MFKIEPVSITKLRKSLNLTQQEFAQLFGVHHMTASKWERGELKPTGYQLALMTDFRQALEKDDNIRTILSAMLVGSSVTNALFMLLHRARMTTKQEKRRRAD